MKKYLFIILGLSLIACKPVSPYIYKDAPTLFVVTDIEQLDGMKQMTTYHIHAVDVNGLTKDINGNSLDFIFSDSTGKYKLGQPIHFTHN